MCHLQVWDLRKSVQFQGGKISTRLFQDFMDRYIEYYDFSQSQLKMC